jgi:hypothetical protein
MLLDRRLATHRRHRRRNRQATAAVVATATTGLRCGVCLADSLVK